MQECSPYTFLHPPVAPKRVSQPDERVGHLHAHWWGGSEGGMGTRASGVLVTPRGVCRSEGTPLGPFLACLVCAPNLQAVCFTEPPESVSSISHFLSPRADGKVDGAGYGAKVHRLTRQERDRNNKTIMGEVCARLSTPKLLFIHSPTPPPPSC